MLSAGPTPRIAKDDWAFTITTEKGDVHRWSWDEFMALPQEDVSTDIHCVTSWSKLGTSWRGVALDTLFKDVDTSFEYTMAHSYGGYTTNVPLADLLNGKAWVAHSFDGKDLEPEHGGPARLLVPHLYFWKSAKWVNGLQMLPQDQPGFWEQNGYNMYGDPWKEQRYW
ncbi:molybdopterin-binding protein [Leifsonia xyli]|nr:molybdopterin-binding protein [Leifsonia xyli]